MMVFLPLDTWIRLIVWMMIGFDVYLAYGMKHGKQNGGNMPKRYFKVVAIVGFSMVVMLAVVGQLHHMAAETPDTGMYIFSMGFALVHLIYYLIRFSGAKDAAGRGC